MTGRAALELDTRTIRIPMRLQRRGEGVAAPARKPRRDETLVKALVRAHRWRRRIESGCAKSTTDLAEQESVTVAYVCRLLPLTCLGRPRVLDAARQSLGEPELTLDLCQEQNPPSELSRRASNVTCTGLPTTGDRPGRNGASSAMAAANSVDRKDAD